MRVASPYVIPAAAARLIAGPYTLYTSSSARSQPMPDTTLPNGKLSVAQTQGVVSVVRWPDGQKAHFNLAGTAELKARLGPMNPPSNEPLVLSRSEGDLDSELVLIGATARQHHGDQLELISASFWLLVAR
jgi:hypothetical protein